MTTTRSTIDRNIRRLEALINGDADRVTVAGVTVIRRDDSDGVMYVIHSPGLTAFADEIEITESFALFKMNGVIIAFIALREE